MNIEIRETKKGLIFKSDEPVFVQWFNKVSGEILPVTAPISPSHQAITIVEAIKNYYQKRNYKWPTLQEALMWQETEMAEVYELLLAKEDGWVRNHDRHTPFSEESLEEELGDAIMMLLVAGIVSHTNPLQALLDKMEQKLQEG